MPVMPAICDTCGTIFSSGVYVENSMNASFLGNTVGPCPSCGRTGHIPDGIFNFIGNAIEILKAPQRTYEELIIFASILRDAQQNNSTPEEVKEKIDNETPQFSSLFELTKNQTFTTWLAVILTIIQMIMPNDEQKASVYNQKIEVNQVINNIYETNSNVEVNRKQGERINVKVPVKSNKVTRNEPCPCGSGVKYKRCHGQ
ncbi:SEC-C metal-binding domain-containing protein [Bacillus sp. AFS002410]|uniref:SEC-C metal-binding domain-containing protein n=1 Tax=Bacillus sp. AFS002410 TaxID=2033481 RepID=UPI00211DA182|nr:SEC-C metal-binding domain-containing protein [Bacillus sp. AFS002410]